MGALASVSHIGPRLAATAAGTCAPGARPWPAPLPNPVAAGAPSMVEVVRRQRAGVMTVQTDEAHVLVIAPFVDVEAVRISTEQFSSPIPVGRAAVVAQAGSYQLDYPPHSEVVLIQLARGRFQAWLTARFAEPRRLRRTVTILGYAADMFDVIDLARDCAKDRAFARGSSSQDELCQALVEALNETGPANDVWVTVQTLKRATDYILDNAGDCTPETVADAAGMTLKTLHRQAQAVLGTSLSAFIRDVRLTAAHRRLKTGMESRPIAMLARDLGFASGSVFARSYRQRFGETPTATRTQAVLGQK
jgi:AraC-like DNA-binding protein